MMHYSLSYKVEGERVLFKVDSEYYSILNRELFSEDSFSIKNFDDISTEFLSFIEDSIKRGYKKGSIEVKVEDFQDKGEVKKQKSDENAD